MALEPQSGAALISKSTKTVTAVSFSECHSPESVELGEKMPAATEAATASTGNGKREIAIQANDFDIERKQSVLPARKRYIPLKFSDYRILAGEEDQEDEEDESFEPGKVAHREKPNKTQAGRRRGRPRKTPLVVEGDESSAGGIDSSNSKKYVTKVSTGFKCNVCGRVFSLRGNAKAHLLTHTDKKPFACELEGCGKKLRTKESWRRHQMSHLGIKMFECSKCDKKFCSNYSLREHMARHTGEKPLTCEVCGRKFRQACVLKRHMTTHSQDKPFKCTVCGRQFALSLYLQSHMRTHTGEKPYSCDICFKKFSHASDVNRHKITHSGEKPFPCTVCGKRYADASSRRRHMKKVHQGPQLVCPICQEAFPKSRSLRQHLLKAHGAEVGSAYEVRVIETQVHEAGTEADVVMGQVLNVMQSDPTVLMGSIEEASEAGNSASQTTSQVTIPRANNVVTDGQQDQALGDVHLTSSGWTYKLVPHQSQENVYKLEVVPAVEGCGDDGSSTHPIIHQLPLSFLQGESSLAVTVPEEESPLLQTSENGLVASAEMKSVTPHVANSSCIQIIVNEEMADVNHQILTNDIQLQAGVPDTGTVSLSLASSDHSILTSSNHSTPPVTDQLITALTDHLISTGNDHLLSTVSSNHQASDGIKEDYSLVARVSDKEMSTDSSVLKDQEHSLAEESSVGGLPKYESNKHCGGEQASLGVSVSVSCTEPLATDVGTNHLAHVVSGPMSLDSMINGDSSCVVSETSTPAAVTAVCSDSSLTCTNGETEKEKLSQDCVVTVSVENVQSPSHQTLSSTKTRTRSVVEIDATTKMDGQSGSASEGDHSVVNEASQSQSHYVYEPDLSSQDYYNWLAAFAQECKECAIPFNKDQFTKISHVHKTLSDFMAMPSGVICDKNNFKVLMTIARDLSEVINQHLSYMFDSLS